MKEILEDSSTGEERYEAHCVEIWAESEDEADHLVEWCKEKQGLRAHAYESSKSGWRYDTRPYYVRVEWYDDD
uniref:Uncharacterized protein n=1 Tax=Clandestinovirus TaxID=2831644 RepID=A0A8F8KPJ1_9VIRU|nr:hypothetical protein KOM_12_161 [Clandestinovirus]